MESKAGFFFVAQIDPTNLEFQTTYLDTLSDINSLANLSAVYSLLYPNSPFKFGRLEKM